MYETTRSEEFSLGMRILQKIRNSGYPISQRRSVYGAECRDGLIHTTAPDTPDYPVLPEFNDTLDWYLLKNRFTDHFLAIETPTAWSLKRRIAVQKKALICALDRLKNNAVK